VIDKVISLFDSNLMTNFIQPSTFANFVSSLLRQKQSTSVQAALQITRQVLECSPMTYAVPCIREGVSNMIKKLSDKESFKKFMNIHVDTDIESPLFDLDIHKVKEALQTIKYASPEDHATRDLYERKYLELIDKQKSKKKGGSDKKEDAQINSGEDQPNAALRIIVQAASILKDFFSNPTFLEQLASNSPQTKLQLGLLGELAQLARDLCQEATVV